MWCGPSVGELGPEHAAGFFVLRGCGAQFVSGECERRLAPVCVLSEALNVAIQWCGVGPVSERWVQSMPLASLCCAHVCTAMRKSPVVVLGNFKAPEGSAVR